MSADVAFVVVLGVLAGIYAIYWSEARVQRQPAPRHDSGTAGRRSRRP